MTARVPSLLPRVFGEGGVHQGAHVIGSDPLRILTPADRWAYAVSWTASGIDDGRTALAGAPLVLDLSVVKGEIGVGWTNEFENAFVEEKFTGVPGTRITLSAAVSGSVGRLVVRNVSAVGPSEFVINTARLSSARYYPVPVSARDVDGEQAPADGGTGVVFDTAEALAINHARMRWVESVQLPLAHARVLDAGAGVGHFVPFYRDRGSTVVALDGRPDNIAEIRRRLPDVEAHVADVERLDPGGLGQFDVIHACGLIYHLESPIAALRNLRAMCRGVLIIETMVCDSSRPLMVLADETKAASQALAGMGCRPSPSFLVLALSRIGFRNVYAAASPPEHPEFLFSWRDNLDTMRDGHPLRCVFVASDERLDQAGLTPLLESPDARRPDGAVHHGAVS